MNTNSTLTVVNPVLDFFSFLRRPHAEKVAAPLRQKVLSLAVIVALNILLSLGASFLVAPIESLVAVEAEYLAEGYTAAVSQQLVLLMGVFIAPFIEEVQFRLWLVPHPFFFFVSFFFTTLQMVPLPFGGMLRDAGLEDAMLLVKGTLYATVGAAITLFFWLRERRGQRYADFFSRHVAVYYYVSAIVFGIAHLANYNYTVEPWWYAPLLIIPQTIAGFVFGYVCTRLGFWYAVLAHTANNLLFTLGDVMNILFGAVGGVVWLAILGLGSLAVVVMAVKGNVGTVAKALPRA